jgi:hypothetical protein
MNAPYNGPALTREALHHVLNSLPIVQPILQVVGIAEIPSETRPRVQIVLADRYSRYHYVLLDRQLEYLVRTGALTRFSVIACLSWRLHMIRRSAGSR